MQVRPARTFTGINRDHPLARGLRLFVPMWDVPFDGCTINDASAARRHLTYHGTTPGSISEQGSAVAFDGTDDYCDMHNAIWQNIRAGSFVIRVNTAVTNGTNYFGATGGDVGDSSLNMIHVNSGGNDILWLQIINGAGVQSSFVVLKGSAVRGAWRTIGVDFGIGGVQMYLDGIQVFNNAGNTFALNKMGATQMHVGRTNTSYAQMDCLLTAVWAERLGAAGHELMHRKPWGILI